MVSLFTGTVPNLTQSQPDFDTNTQAILDYIASLAPELNAWVGAYVQDTTSNSSTSNSVGTGSKTFAVEAGKGYKVNMTVRASATYGNYMDGIVTAYSGTSLTVNFTAATGSGTFTSWQIFLTIPGSNVTLGSNTFTGDQFVPDEAYDATGWNGDLSVPTKNAIRDKIEAILSAILNATNDPTFSSVSSTDSVSAEWVRGYVDKNAIGVNQTWQEAEYTNTGATFTDGKAKYRNQNITYTNTSGRPITIQGYLNCTTANNFQVLLNGNTMTFESSVIGGVTPFFLIVPNGATYLVNPGGLNFSVIKWWELR